MTEGKLTFATLVATPTKTSWSQAYTAGKLFAVLSLEQESPAKDLAATGKEIINALVEEYFTLETKNLDTIKAAVTQTTKKIPASLSASFVVVSLVDTIVYAYSFGSGKILLKRHDRVGPILKTNEETDPVVHAVSGYVEHSDSLVLETKQFAQVIHTNDFAAEFKTPAEAVEMLSPKVHGSDNGGASAIILLYQKEDHPASLAFAPDAFEKETSEQEKLEEKEEIIEEIKSPLEQEVIQTHSKDEGKMEEEPLYTTKPKRKFSLPKISLRFPFKWLLLLLIPLLLLGALGYGIYTTKQKQEENKTQQLFDQVYPQAQKQYDEGISLLSLNKQLALDDFTKAKKIIDDNINKFPKDSPQKVKMQELLTKVEQQGVGGNSSSDTPSLSAKQASSSDSSLLTAIMKNNATYGAQADSTIYIATNESVKTSDGKTVLEKNDDWKTLAGLGSFNANIYVLDKGEDQILKYLGGVQSSKSVYASGGFNKAVSMSIDSSIYVLSSDGKIAKYTKGSKDTFSITGLTTPLSGATRIFTNANTDNVYVLDQGNKRVVMLSKTGTFGQSYTSDIFAKATDLDVHEKDKKIFVLSSGKIFEVDLP